MSEFGCRKPSPATLKKLPLGLGRAFSPVREHDWCCKMGAGEVKSMAVGQDRLSIPVICVQSARRYQLVC